MNQILLKNISKQYSDFALKDINLKCGNYGGITCLVGESGSGKSTLLKLIAGLERPSSGSITIQSRSIFDQSCRINISPENRDIALIFQRPSLFPNRTVLENIKFAVKQNRDAEQIANLMLKTVGMERYAESTPFNLSGGQQQLVTLARAFAQEPSVILLDEPFSSLDAILRPNIREKIVSLIKERDLISIIVTHDPAEALEIADEIVVMSHGKIVMYDLPYNVYYKPKDLKIANLFGCVNHIKGYVKNNKFLSAWGELDLPEYFCSQSNLYIRPEGIVLCDNLHDSVEAFVNKVQKFSGVVDITVDNCKYRFKCPIDSLPSECDIIKVRLNTDYLIHLT